MRQLQTLMTNTNINDMCLEMFSESTLTFCKFLIYSDSVREGFEPSVTFRATKL